MWFARVRDCTRHLPRLGASCQLPTGFCAQAAKLPARQQESRGRQAQDQRHGVLHSPHTPSARPASNAASVNRATTLYQDCIHRSQREACAPDGSALAGMGGGRLLGLRLLPFRFRPGLSRQLLLCIPNGVKVRYNARTPTTATTARTDQLHNRRLRPLVEHLHLALQIALQIPVGLPWDNTDQLGLRNRPS